MIVFLILVFNFVFNLYVDEFFVEFEVIIVLFFVWLNSNYFEGFFVGVYVFSSVFMGLRFF